MLQFVFVALLAAQVDPRPFDVASADGVIVHGQADSPEHAANGAVILVAGTGPFDRDARFAPAGTPRAALFADLAERLSRRGIASVRYDKRGARYGSPRETRLDTAVVVTATTGAMRDDLSAVYDWTRSADGLNARCVAFFAHSEGMAHVGRLAASGAEPPVAVVGMGPILTDPVTNFRWNLVQRDGWSLRDLDADKDGYTSNAEVEAGFARSPAAVNGTMAPYLHPEGGWTLAAIENLEKVQAGVYEPTREQVLAQADDAPWPSADAPSGVYQWWKSWFLDEATVASNLARWNVPVIAHIGTIDSQVHPDLQRAAGQAALGDRLVIKMHEGVGHSLGVSPTYAPMDEARADELAEDLVAALRDCSELG